MFVYDVLTEIRFSPQNSGLNLFSRFDSLYMALEDVLPQWYENHAKDILTMSQSIVAVDFSMTSVSMNDLLLSRPIF